MAQTPAHEDQGSGGSAAAPAAALARALPTNKSVLAGAAQQDVLLRALFDDSSRGIILTGAEGTMRHVNAAAATMLGYTTEELSGRRFNDITHPEDVAVGASLLREMVEGQRNHATLEKRYLCKDGRTLWVSLGINGVRDADGKLMFCVVTIEDLSLRRQIEAERVAAKEQIIAAQRETLRQISTPLIPIAEGVLALPLIGPVDGDRARLMLETLLESVSRERARTVLLDITGVPAVDGEVAVLLVRATQAVRLLGAEVLLTGIRPEVAQRLVGLGVDLSGIRTLGSFQLGITQALAGRVRKKEPTRPPETPS